MILGLLGGWGYNNLGDEAILAGYLRTLSPYASVVVGSVDPRRTSDAQNLVGVKYVREGGLGKTDAVLLGGGGYLNGSWVPEINKKTERLTRDVYRTNRTVVSSVEVRALAGSRTGAKLARLLEGSALSVRDADSQGELATLEIPSKVLPDGISLLFPHLSAYIQPVPELTGKILVNLLDVDRRPDADECELGSSGFADFAAETIASLGDRAVGLVIGDGDYSFMRRFPNLPLLTPRSVSDMVSAINSASGILSVRMHPALIATALGKPTASVPYCGKVRPTLTNIGVQTVLLEDYSQSALEKNLSAHYDFSEVWSSAHTTVRDWLLSQLNLSTSSE